MVYSGNDIGLAASPLLFGALMDTNRPAWVFVCIGAFQLLAIATAVRVGSNTAKKQWARTSSCCRPEPGLTAWLARLRLALSALYSAHQYSG
ncbi:hypothetical protein ACFS07_16690 [Undibacterium arcticum]